MAWKRATMGLERYVGKRYDEGISERDDGGGTNTPDLVNGQG